VQAEQNLKVHAGTLREAVQGISEFVQRLHH
jgi:hypothetical protein